MNLNEMDVTQIKAAMFDEYMKIEQAKATIIAPATQNIQILGKRLEELMEAPPPTSHGFEGELTTEGIDKERTQEDKIEASEY